MGRTSLDAKVVRTSLSHCGKRQSTFCFEETGGGLWGPMEGADHALQVEQTEALAYVIADDDQVGPEEPPALGAGRVVELEAVLALARADLKDKGLVHVSEQGDGGRALEVLSPLADPPARGQPDVLDPSLEYYLGVGALTIEMSIFHISRPREAES